MKKVIVFLLLFLIFILGVGAGRILPRISYKPGPYPIPGEVNLRFKKDVTKDQAQALLDAYELTLQKPDQFYTYRTITLTSRNNQPEKYVEPISSLDILNVNSVQLLDNPLTKQPQLIVDFEPRASVDEVEVVLQIFQDLQLNELADGGSPPYIVNVSLGQEEAIASRLRREPIIEVAMQNSSMLPNPAAYQSQKSQSN